MSQVSVIMPCLNMVPYIEECLGRVLLQTLTDIDVLVVDAGSEDGTLEILQTYANKDSRIKIIHSAKKSYGYQVNLGVAEATGEYIGIVDTDDRIAVDMYEILYDTAVKNKADYVKGTSRMFYTITGTDTYYYPILQFPKENYGKMPQLLTMDNFLWNGIYRNDFLKKIKFHESFGAAFQDLGGLLQTQINARNAVYISKCVYEYRQDNANSSANNKKGMYFVEDEYRWAERFLEGQSTAWHESFYRKQFLHFMNRVHTMAVSGSFWEESLSHMLAIAKKLKCVYECGILTKKVFSEEEWEDMKLFWESPYLLYVKYRDFYESNKDSLQQIIQFSNNRQQIVIFGSGRLGQFIHGQLLYNGYKNVRAYCDNDGKVQGSIKNNINILSPGQAVENFSGAGFIIANKKNAEDMQNQLLDMGVKKINIVIYSSIADIRLFGRRKS